MIVATVFKTGGRYTREHVEMLEDQLGPHVPLTVFTDDEDVLRDRGSFARRLTYHLPGWWSKMELFNPAFPEDIFYFDLDTGIRRRPRMLTRGITAPMILRDFYRPQGLQSSVMCIPHHFKAFIWRKWMEGPEVWMELYNRDGLGDQAFLEHCGKAFWGRLQDKYPGEFVSWKADSLSGRPLPTLARVIVFHGDPKPWDIRYDQQTWRH